MIPGENDIEYERDEVSDDSGKQCESSGPQPEQLVVLADEPNSNTDVSIEISENSIPTIPAVDDEDNIEGRVVEIKNDPQELIVPDKPSILEGEVLLVRRPDSKGKALPDDVRVKRVKADRNEHQNDEEPHGALYSFLDTLRFISLGLLVGILLVVFVVQRNDVYGSSMEPTLYNRDAVFVEMISVYLKNYERGDIVTIDAEGMEGYYHKENLIKRIVGMPGETVTIVDGLVYINGSQLIEPYLTDGVMTYVSSEGTEKGYDQIVLGPNQYYCLGDNRGASNDSRRLGPFGSDQIKSHVIARIYPFDAIELF